MRIAVIGGTGKEGRGLAMRWAIAGHEVVLGSRDGARASQVAAELSQLAGHPLSGAENIASLDGADVVLLSVPYSGHGETLRALAPSLASRPGRVLIDITVPLKPPRVAEVHLPAGGAAALEAQAIVGAQVHVVAALHHVSSTQLADPKKSIDCDVLFCGDDAAAKAKVGALIADLGLRGLDAGALANAVALESLTPILLALNKRYKSVGAGIRFTNIDVR